MKPFAIQTLPIAILATTLVACANNNFQGAAATKRDAVNTNSSTGTGTGPGNADAHPGTGPGTGSGTGPGSGSGTGVGTGTDNGNGSQPLGTQTVYVPLGGSIPIPGGTASCTPADPSIATCSKGQIDGQKLGSTAATAGPGGPALNVVVYDPKNPPPGVTTAGGDATGTGTGPGLSSDNGVVVANIPGVTVQRVGVNFEDLGPYGDHDYNDIVMCFTGAFKVDGTNAVSIGKQTVQGTFSWHSACHHRIDIKILDQNGAQQSENVVDDASLPASLPLTFDVGWVLNVTMTSYTEPCTDSNGDHPDLGGTHLQSDPSYAVVAANVCNTTGN